jgi:uncharacterized membrane protein
MILRGFPAGGLLGAAVATAAAMPVEPLLSLALPVHGLVLGIVAAHGYGAGVALARLGAGAAGQRATVAAVLAASATAAGSGSGSKVALLPPGYMKVASLTPVLVVAAGVLVVAVLLARAVRCAVRAPRPTVGVGLAVCLLMALPGLTAAATPPVDGPGREGRIFLDGVAAHPDRAPLRVYAGLGSGPTLPERVRGAVAAFEEAGGLARSTVLVAVPTGSGWVNQAAVGALEHLVHGDVATVVLQYAQRPSWQEYVFGSGSAEASAVELVGTMRSRLDALPAADRPRLLVYGESLGAIGAAATTADADAVLVAGMPAAAWEHAPAAGVTPVLHVDDPVGWFSPRLLVERPDGWPGDWLPVVSFWTTAGSLLAALDAPPGHGHRYGTDLLDDWQALLADRCRAVSAPAPRPPAARPLGADGAGLAVPSTLIVPVCRDSPGARVGSRA